MTIIAVEPWLKRHLQATGAWNADGYSRRVTCRRCRCDQLILAGLDGDMCALPVDADPAPLDAFGEMLARLGGRSTYALRTRPYLRLTRREAYGIRYSPAGDPGSRFDVLAAHACGQQTNLPAVRSVHATKVAPPIPVDPPF